MFDFSPRVYHDIHAMKWRYMRAFVPFCNMLRSDQNVIHLSAAVDWLRQTSDPEDGNLPITSNDVDFVSLGFHVSNASTNRMASAHRHDEIEITVLEVGWIDYVFGGRRIRNHAGELCVRWAAIPHQSVDFEPGGIHYSLKIPRAQRFRVGRCRCAPHDPAGSRSEAAAIGTASAAHQSVHNFERTCWASQQV